MNGLTDTILNMMDTTQEPEDYIGEDGLLHCGKCHKPKEAYFPQGKALFGRDRHPSECDCRRAERERLEKRDADEKHNAEVERLKREGFSNPAMRHWTFENDNGKCPQIGKAYSYVEKWETVRTENLGYLLWGNVGSGKSYFAGCIANALMEKEMIGCMLLFLTCLWQLPFVMLIASKTGYLPSVLITFMANIVSSTIGAEKAWFFLNPYAIPARVVCPFFKIHPNGLPIEDGSPLLAAEHIFPALAISLALAAASFWICSKLLGSGGKSNG